MFDRVVNQLSATAATTSQSGTSTTSAQAAAALMRFGGFGSGGDRNQNKVEEEPLREEDGQVSVQVAEKMLKWHAEAIGRCVEMSPATDVYAANFCLHASYDIAHAILLVPSTRLLCSGFSLLQSGARMWRLRWRRMQLAYHVPDNKELTVCPCLQC